MINGVECGNQVSEVKRGRSRERLDPYTVAEHQLGVYARGYAGARSAAYAGFQADAAA